jgi:uncharacterized protein YcfL
MHISTKLFKEQTMKYIFLLLALVGCASKTPASVETRGETTMQELVMDKHIQSMGRNEVIDGIKQCETAGLRAIPIYAKRKINGYSAETVVDVTCGPRYK